MSREEQVDRLISMFLCIQSRSGITADELAREFNCSKRTIYRDIVTLSLKFPIYEERDGRKKVYKIDRDYKGGLSYNFTLGEVMALYFGSMQIKFLQGTTLGSDFLSLTEKIKHSLPKQTIKYLNEIQSLMIPFDKGVKDYSGARDILKVLNEAMIKKKRCMITYHALTKGKTSSYRIEPLKLFSFRGALYIAVRVPVYNHSRTLEIGRIKKLKMIDEPIDVPEDFDIDTPLKESFGIFVGKPMDVEILFAKSIAPFIKERTWHPSQKIKDLPNGDIILKMKSGGLVEIKWWVMTWGPRAEILKPKRLREEIKRDLRDSINRYK